MLNVYVDLHVDILFPVHVICKALLEKTTDDLVPFYFPSLLRIHMYM